MPHYYFDILNTVFIYDQNGHELPDDAAALRYARGMKNQLVPSLTLSPQQQEDWHIVVRTQADGVIGEMAFAEPGTARSRK